MQNSYLSQECNAGDKRELLNECEWYQLCIQEGFYKYKRCPQFSSVGGQMFNPLTNNCSDIIKLAVENDCNAYRECLLIETVSPFRKWTETRCESANQHFDQQRQKCIDSKDSTCGIFHDKLEKGFDCFYNKF